MSQAERQPQEVTFHVLADNQHQLRRGDYAGYIDWISVFLAGHAKQSKRCMLYIERVAHPELFSPNNSMTSIYVDVTADVHEGTITYD